MKIYFIERNSDGLIFNGFQEGGQPPLEGMLRVKEVAVSILGGAVEDWVVRSTDIDREPGKVIRLIERLTSGQPGFTAHQAALLSIEGLSAVLSRGWFPGCRIMTQDDSYDISSLDQDQGVALDVVEDGGGLIQLQPYTWDPDTESKADLPADLTLILADLLRGVLPAGAQSLDALREEEG